jgi:hypothetical protein
MLEVMESLEAFRWYTDSSTSLPRLVLQVMMLMIGNNSKERDT